ncbi:MAG: H-NS histone family protein [Dokdonella sp.]
MAINMKGLNAAQLDALIQQADQRKRELRDGGVAKVRDKVIAMVKAEGFSIDELFGSVKNKGKAKAKAKTKVKAKVAPKYSNPADKEQTWSGRGRQPLWFAAAIKAGKTERSLLIK